MDVGKASTEQLPTAYMLAMFLENNSVLHTHVCCVLCVRLLRALQVAEVINEELPETVDAVRLSGIEFSDAMEEIGQLRYDFVCVCVCARRETAEVATRRLSSMSLLQYSLQY